MKRNSMSTTSLFDNGSSTLALNKKNSIENLQKEKFTLKNNYSEIQKKRSSCSNTIQNKNSLLNELERYIKFGFR